MLKNGAAPASKTEALSTPAGLIIGILAAAGITVSLAQTLVVPIIGKLPEIFDTTAANTSWIITVTLLVGAVTTPVMGRLADMYGKKPMMLISLLPFIVGSVVCAMATDLIPMIIGRGLQGLASGLIPLGISLMHDILPREKTGAAIALMSSSMGIGGALGLPIAAGIAQFASWRVLFWVTALVALAVTIAIFCWIPRIKPSASAARFDYFGALGLALGLIALLLSISKGAEWGWESVTTISLAVVGVLVLLLWGWFELKQKAPLVDLRTASRPVVLMTNLASILIGITMYAMNLILPQVMQLPVELGYGLGQSMLQMGLWLIPMGLGMMLISKAGAGISAKRGPRVTLALAGLVIAAGYALTAIVLSTIGNRPAGPFEGGMSITLTLIAFSVCCAIVGCGIGLAFGSMPSLIMGSVPAAEKASANGFNSLMRSLGTTISAAVVGAILAAMVHNGMPTLAGFLLTLLLSCGCALIASLIAYFIPAEIKVIEQQ
ncbi:MFS transporter [Corynebacterium sp. A21]|uniref:MFS transporter n=1 Tax=Corynebacterium sp. A21 TaxID=3457318 RepID=UPI003FD1C913